MASAENTSRADAGILGGEANAEVVI